MNEENKKRDKILKTMMKMIGCNVEIKNNGAENCDEESYLKCLAALQKLSDKDAKKVIHAVIKTRFKIIDAFDVIDDLKYDLNDELQGLKESTERLTPDFSNIDLDDI